ncbi:ABC transporter permease [bacterium]|nr:ABC transporter permease [bacterium]
MKLLIKISLRNLLRQKQRNVLLGIGIAFGMTILILSNAFSHGLSDILLNRIIKMMAGHFIVSVQEKPEDKTRGLIRDKDKFIRIIQENVQGDVQITERITTQNMGFGQHNMNQALGNGASSIIIVIGVDKTSFLSQDQQVISGRMEDIWADREKENPIMIFDTIAENLNVKLNDTIRVRFSTVYGQVQAARFTVVCIQKASNPFMGVAAFTSQETLKPLIGLKPNETGSLSVVINNLDNPKKVIEQARRLHEALKPGAAGFKGQLKAGTVSEEVTVLGISPDEKKRREFARHLQLTAGKAEDLWSNPEDALISRKLADQLAVGLGDSLSLTYQTRFEGLSIPREVRVKAIFTPNRLLRDEMVLLHPKFLYETFIPVLPLDPVDIGRDSQLFSYLMPEWTLLEMSPDREAMLKKYNNLRDEDWHGRIIDIPTMYAMASEVLNMESVLKMVTLVAVLILFFIILIGVINTLRMTIRERTREIGTVRAIGMQRNDVRWIFLLEVIFLAFFASVAGTILSFILMKASVLLTLEPEGMFSIFLVDHHLHFLPTISDIFSNLAIIVVITAVTAIIPAHRASKMPVADALRHVE